MKKLLGVSILTGALLATGNFTYAQDQQRDQDREQLQDQDMSPDRDRDRDQDQIYGSHLMTEEERLQYREQMRSTATEAEREQIRNEHHERMLERAKERGITIPEDMPHGDYRMGPNKDGMGVGGMGPGGMGSGKGK